MLQHIPKNYISRFLLIPIIILLPACAKKIEEITHQKAIFQSSKDDIIIRVHKIDAKESRSRFGKSLLSYGYQPLQFTIYNDSDDALLMRASSIDLPLEASYSVAHAAHTPTLAYTVAPAYLAGLFFWPALIPVGGAAFWMMSNNQTLTQKVMAHAFEGDAAIEILPYERMTRVLFVKKDNLPSAFSLHLFNIHKKTFIPFTIDLKD